MSNAIKNLVFCFFSLGVLLSTSIHAEVARDKRIEEQNLIKDVLEVPYERPIGFTYNVAALASMTFEARFNLGLIPNLNLVVPISYQHTPELPWYDFKKGEMGAVFGIRRIHLGAGIRGYFYKYDSWDGWYIEATGRGGLTKFGDDPWVWSVIPGAMFGYTVVYDSGYTLSLGLGFEWEFTFAGEEPGYFINFMRESFLTITKFPVTAEISLGWTW